VKTEEKIILGSCIIIAAFLVVRVGSVVKFNVKLSNATADISSSYVTNNGDFTPVNQMTLDSDNDGLPDRVEIIYGTNPYNADSDGDGSTDGAEVATGHNPLDSGDSPKIASSSFTTNSTFAFYVGGVKVNSAVCGTPLDFKADNYSGNQIWLVQTENGIPGFNGTLDVPYSQVPACNKDEGVYVSDIYSVVGGKKGTYLGTVDFELTKAADLSVPYIDFATQAYGLEKNTVRAGLQTIIYGSNFSNVTKIFIDSQSISIDKSAINNNGAASNIVFSAPSNLTSGTAVIYVQKADGKVSNSLAVKTINSTTSAPLPTSIQNSSSSFICDFSWDSPVTPDDKGVRSAGNSDNVKMVFSGASPSGTVKITNHNTSDGHSITGDVQADANGNFSVYDHTIIDAASYANGTYTTTLIDVNSGKTANCTGFVINASTGGGGGSIFDELENAPDNKTATNIAEAAGFDITSFSPLSISCINSSQVITHNSTTGEYYCETPPTSTTSGTTTFTSICPSGDSIDAGGDCSSTLGLSTSLATPLPCPPDTEDVTWTHKVIDGVPSCVPSYSTPPATPLPCPSGIEGVTWTYEIIGGIPSCIPSYSVPPTTPLPCPSGIDGDTYIQQANGWCYLSSLTPSTANSSCQSPYVLMYGECVLCPSGYNIVNGECVGYNLDCYGTSSSNPACVAICMEDSSPSYCTSVMNTYCSNNPDDMYCYQYSTCSQDPTSSDCPNFCADNPYSSACVSNNENDNGPGGGSSTDACVADSNSDTCYCLEYPSSDYCYCLDNPGDCQDDWSQFQQ
jgi:hypothetical protein